MLGERSARARTLAAEYGLGATYPDEEVAVIVASLAEIRRDVEPYGVPIPVIEEVEVGLTTMSAAE